MPSVFAAMAQPSAIQAAMHQPSLPKVKRKVFIPAAPSIGTPALGRIQVHRAPPMKVRLEQSSVCAQTAQRQLARPAARRRSQAAQEVLPTIRVAPTLGLKAHGTLEAHPAPPMKAKADR